MLPLILYSHVRMYVHTCMCRGVGMLEYVCGVGGGGRVSACVDMSCICGIFNLFVCTIPN